jgi:hypothetical protein
MFMIVLVTQSFERSLFASGSTLVVVPVALLEHWYEQIKTHLNLFYLGAASVARMPSSDDSSSCGSAVGRGVVYLDGFGDIADVQAPLSRLKADTDMPPAPVLASYLIVITTFDRCVSECRRMQQQGKVGYSSNASSSGSSISIPLLQVHWLRLVVDEGHQMNSTSTALAEEASAAASARRQRRDVSRSSSFRDGGDDIARAAADLLTVERQSEVAQARNDGGGGKSPRRPLAAGAAQCYYNAALSAPLVDFVTSIAAERRWVMSGTPTTGTSSTAALRQLQILLCFLRHPSYGGVNGEGYLKHQLLWEHTIVKPCLQQSISAWNAIDTILSSIMVRHTKVRLYAVCSVYLCVFCI